MTGEKTKEKFQNSKESKFQFFPQNITLKDDAFHGSKALNFTEWWYFDATFDNGYSIQLSVRVLSVMKRFIFFTFLRLDIYKDRKLQSHKRKIYLKKGFYASRDIPLVKIYGKEVLKGHIDEKTGDWIYDLSFELDDTSADLRFIGCTKGYKGTIGYAKKQRDITREGKWGVILPRASVKGKIKIKDKEIAVNGTGYHDHNWDVKGTAALNFGWFWGKTSSKNYTVVWSTIFKTRFLGQPLLVLSKVDDGYTSFKQENIRFVAEDIRKEDGKPVPHHFVLDAFNENISLHVTMKILGIHRARMMGIMNYWRYHAKCTGSIAVDDEEEKIDEVHMIEFLRFG